MRAVLWNKGSGAVRLGDAPEPAITAPDEIKARVLCAGVCGTDRDAYAKKAFVPPDGRKDIVLGHEVLAEALETGPDVKGIEPGDYVAFTIRRGCDRCLPCRSGRPDLCATGEYKERGLDYMDGFNSEFVIDKEANAVKAPRELKEIGALCEPLSTIEKALAEVELAQRRLPESASANWFEGRRCLVLGLGPVGLLAAMVLTLRGGEVFGLDVVDEDSARPAWLKAIGGRYLDGRKIGPGKAHEEAGGRFSLVFQATGAPAASFGLISSIGPNGAFVFFSAGEGAVSIDGGDIRAVIDNNIILIGSVSSSRGHFEMGIRDLLSARCRWGGGQIDKLISHRYSPSEFKKTLVQHPADEIKAVIEWGGVVE